MADNFIDNPEENTPAPAASAAAPSAGNPELIKALIAKQQKGTLTKDDIATAVKAVKSPEQENASKLSPNQVQDWGSTHGMYNDGVGGVANTGINVGGDNGVTTPGAPIMKGTGNAYTPAPPAPPAAPPAQIGRAHV